MNIDSSEHEYALRLTKEEANALEKLLCEQDKHSSPPDYGSLLDWARNGRLLSRVLHKLQCGILSK